MYIVYKDCILKKYKNLPYKIYIQPSICHAYMSLRVTQSETKHSTASSKEAGQLI